MTWRFYLSRALSLPPHVILAKAAHKVKTAIGNRARKHRDLTRSTYLPLSELSSPRLHSFLKGIEFDRILIDVNQAATVAGRYLNHFFDLLGSGWIRVEHGMLCHGVEGYRYEMGPPVTVDREGKWLLGRINEKNRNESARIWRLVDEGYKPVDWQLDFKSGYRWSEKTWCFKVPFVHEGSKPGVDIKVPWELARMQHLPQLAVAHGLACLEKNEQLNRPELYVREFQNQVLDFIATNPPRFGVNWACMMDVAIRVCNWLVAYDLFRAHGASFDQQFEEEFCRSVFQHGAHLYGNLEWDPEQAGNHYLADIVGLVFVSAYLPRTEEIDIWLAFAVQELVSQVKRQYGEDGANFEGSVCYHRLSTELVLYATALVLGLPPNKQAAFESYDHARHIGQPPLNPAPLSLYPASGSDRLTPFPPWYFDRLAKMASYVADVTKPNGEVAQIGDNDNGRLLKLSPTFVRIELEEAKRRFSGPVLRPLGEDRFYWLEDHLDHAYLVDAILRLFKPGVCSGREKRCLEAHMVEQLAGYYRITSGEGSQQRRIQQSDQRVVPLKCQGPHVDLLADLNVSSYPDLGLYVYRSVQLHMVIRCGPVGRNGYGGHSHNDSLSFELSFEGIPIFVDPGTYLYIPVIEKRNCFRSTAMHNTLSISGKEQNPWERGRPGLFRLPEHAKARAVQFEPKQFVGEHTGFGSVHRRMLDFEPQRVRGRDECDVRGPKKVVFQLHPDLVPHVTVDAKVAKLSCDGILVTLTSDSTTWSLADTFHSRSYGIVEPSKSIYLLTERSPVDWTVSFAKMP